jgi:hypothetical protein
MGPQPNAKAKRTTKTALAILIAPLLSENRFLNNF